ncbi:DUF3775 domain-containing protein [Rhizobium sp. BK376]|uniref:DUF3775 domain-containing protein n=1 Tax=Rhizobium sp. BK376 TaxID=2512149 RepID=UPI001042EB39|nr:DUF3775 domain-containing protein [Rhizobium sp. BK376]TCR75612.1 uncharacterized protein DUF3775 [Rhizobium sp. BK376]
MNNQRREWIASISPDKVRYLIAKSRKFDVKDVGTDPHSGSNATDDGMIAILEEHPDDVVESELRSAIRSLNEDEQVDLVAMAWLGRRDGDINDWADLRRQAADAHNGRTASYLLGTPLLADYLEEAPDQFGETPTPD